MEHYFHTESNELRTRWPVDEEFLDSMTFPTEASCAFWRTLMTAADRWLRCLEVKVRNGSPAHVVPDPFASKENEEKRSAEFPGLAPSGRLANNVCSVRAANNTRLSMCGHIPSIFFQRAAPQVLQCGFLLGSKVHSRCLPRETWQRWCGTRHANAVEGTWPSCFASPHNCFSSCTNMFCDVPIFFSVIVCLFPFFSFCFFVVFSNFFVCLVFVLFSFFVSFLLHDEFARKQQAWRSHHGYAVGHVCDGSLWCCLRSSQEAGDVPRPHLCWYFAAECSNDPHTIDRHTYRCQCAPAH